MPLSENAHYMFFKVCRPNRSKLKKCHSARYEVLAVVLFFDYPEHGGSKLLVNTGTDIHQKAGILIDYQ
jgi:hypothetical protein